MKLEKERCKPNQVTSLFQSQTSFWFVLLLSRRVFVDELVPSLQTTQQ